MQQNNSLNRDITVQTPPTRSAFRLLQQFLMRERRSERIMNDETRREFSMRCYLKRTDKVAEQRFVERLKKKERMTRDFTAFVKSQMPEIASLEIFRFIEMI